MCLSLGAIYTGYKQESIVAPRYVVVATLCAFAAQIAITAIGWGKPETVTPKFPPAASSRFLVWMGLLALSAAGLFRMTYYTASGAPWIESTAFTAITVFSVGVFWRSNARLLSWGTLIVLAFIAVYAEVFHSGQGRLRIVALACAVFVVVTARYQRKVLKWLTVAAIAPALYYLAEDRKELQESLSAGASEGRNGLESMLGSVQVFGRLIQAQAESGFPLSYGVNLFSFPFAWTESLFPNAPVALGYELVKVTDPGRYGTGYSVVATTYGEAVYNFGYVGLVLMVPVIVWLLNLLDHKMVGSMSKPQSGAMTLLAVVFWAMLAGGIADMVWSGQHTFLTRATFRLPLLIGITALLWLHVRLAPKPRPARRIPRVQRTRPAMPEGMGRRAAVGASSDHSYRSIRRGAGGSLAGPAGR